jgi:hypothetical protein
MMKGDISSMIVIQIRGIKPTVKVSNKPLTLTTMHLIGGTENPTHVTRKSTLISILDTMNINSKVEATLTTSHAMMARSIDLENILNLVVESFSRT